MTAFFNVVVNNRDITLLVTKDDYYKPGVLEYIGNMNTCVVF